MPSAVAAASISVTAAPEAVAFMGLLRKPTVFASGTRPCSSSSSLDAISITRSVTPVRLPPGRFNAATMPIATGSVPSSNTIGIVEVAAFAASAVTVP